MWRYGIGEAPPPPLKKVTCRNKENDKQYETKRVWNLLQSWLVGNQGVLKGGGGVQLLLPPPKIFLGEKRRKGTKKNGWGGRWWYLLTCFSGVTFFREELRYF